MDKIMRMNSVTSTIENGFVHKPDKTHRRWISPRACQLSQRQICRSGGLVP